jgi:micrococcal nuclease
MRPRFEVFKDSREQYRFRLRTPDNEIIISSNNSYSTQKKCMDAIDSIKSTVSTTKTEDKIITQAKPSFAWYLLPALLAFAGSIIGYFTLKSKDRRLARNIVVIGIIVGIVWGSLFILLPKSNIDQTPIVATPVTNQTSTSISTISPTTVYSTKSITTSPITSEFSIFKVKEVMDGDSIVLDDDTDVRLLGINAPEKGYSFEKESKDRLSMLILGKEVRLESDFEDKDRFGRLLRYVFVGDTFVNVQLVKEGLATVYMESGLKYEDDLNDAEYYAKINALGIWKKDVAYADYIYIVTFHYNAAGNDDENLNDEYVVLGNKGDISINMTGWTIKDDINHIFIFPQFVIEPGKIVTIYTGFGTNTNDSLYWGSQGAIWSNKGDTLYLRNSDGELILSYEY